MSRSNGGFSLIELVIALGIGSVVTLSLISLLNALADQQGLIDGKIDLSILKQDLQGDLSKPDNCIKVLGSTLRINPAEIRKKSPKGQVIPGLNLLNGEIIVPNGSRLKKYALICDDLKLSDSDPSATPANTYRALLQGNFRAGKGKHVSLQRVTFGTATLVTNAGGLVTGCSFTVDSAGGTTTTGGEVGTIDDVKRTCLQTGRKWHPSSISGYVGGSCYSNCGPGGPTGTYSASQASNGVVTVTEDCAPENSGGP